MSDSSNLTLGAPYPPVQITKINNGGPFTFLDPANVTYPVAPLVSANFLPQAGGQDSILKIRATLYINTDVHTKPRIKSVVEDGDTLTIIYKHDLSDTTPETCDVWYVEANYTSKTANQITQVLSYLQGSNKGGNIELGDPPVSRGTKTDPTN
jgi:hypothetical protein